MSKHDPTAYHGKMDRITLSGALYNCYEDIYELEKIVSKELPDIVNLQNQAYNDGLHAAQDMLEDLHDRIFTNTKESLQKYWQLTPKRLQEIEDNYRKGLGI